MTNQEMRQKLKHVRDWGGRRGDAALVDIADVVESLLPADPPTQEELYALAAAQGSLGQVIVWPRETSNAADERVAVLAFLDSIKCNRDAKQVVRWAAGVIRSGYHRHTPVPPQAFPPQPPLADKPVSR